MANFHIYFLIHLTKYLGFFPNDNFSTQNRFFDLQAGYFVQIKPFHQFYLENDQSNIMSQMLKYSENQHEGLDLNYNERINLLEKILDYYTLHNENIQSINAFNIFKDVFH